MPANLPDATRSDGAYPSQGLTLIDPPTLMRIKSLEMRARAVVEGFYSGIHRSPYHGFSVEFSEYRPYTPGDDLRYLDWRLFARSDRYYIKRFEDETNLLCYLLVDTSRSMGFTSGEVTKSEYARTLAATMGYFLSLQRDAVGVVTFDDQIVEYLPPRYRTGHLRHLMAALQREPAGKGTNLQRPLEQIAQTVRRRGLVVLISDLLVPPQVLHTQLGYLRARGHDILALRVLDQAELDFTFSDPRIFEDLESGTRLFIDPQAAREEYLANFRAHAQQLSEACAVWGVDLVECPTSRPLELALFDLLKARQVEGPQSARRYGQPGRGV